jgi:hypothetical protein
MSTTTTTESAHETRDFIKGERVRTADPLIGTFDRGLHPHRRAGVTGRVMRRMTSGDLYYEVSHDDGTVAAYDGDELAAEKSDAPAHVTDEDLAEIEARIARAAATRVDRCPAHEQANEDRARLAAELRAIRAQVDVTAEVRALAGAILDQPGDVILRAIAPHVERAAVLARGLSAAWLELAHTQTERNTARGESAVLAREAEGLRAEVADTYVRLDATADRVERTLEDLAAARAEVAEWASRFEQAKGQADTARAEIERLKGEREASEGRQREIGVAIDKVIAASAARGPITDAPTLALHGAVMRLLAALRSTGAP